MPVKTLTEPTEYPVSLADAKSYLRVGSDTSEDTLISSFIVAATRILESETGRTIARKQLELTLDNFPDAINLPNPPIVSVERLSFDDTEGVEQVIASTDYVLDNSSVLHGWIVPAPDKTWPSTKAGAVNTVRVRYTAGFSASDAPEDIKLWIKAHVATWYTNRESDLCDNLSQQPALRGIVANHRLHRL